MRKLCFDDCEASVVVGVGLVVGSVIGNPLDDLLRVVSTSERTFCVSPIGFGLASMTGRHGTATSLRIAQRAGRFRRTQHQALREIEECERDDFMLETARSLVNNAVASVNLIWPLLIFSFGPTLW
jgi:hypothetical protein